MAQCARFAHLVAQKFAQVHFSFCARPLVIRIAQGASKEPLSRQGSRLFLALPDDLLAALAKPFRRKYPNKRHALHAQNAESEPLSEAEGKARGKSRERATDLELQFIF